MLPVQNHDNIPFEQVNRSKPGYLAYMDNGGISIHPCIQVQLQRCKYSQCQLGYRLRYREKEGLSARQKEFLERLLSFCSRIRKGRLRKIYGITALTLGLDLQAPNTQPAKPESGGRMVPEPKRNL